MGAVQPAARFPGNGNRDAAPVLANESGGRLTRGQKQVNRILGNFNQITESTGFIGKMSCEVCVVLQLPQVQRQAGTEFERLNAVRHLRGRRATKMALRCQNG